MKSKCVLYVSADEARRMEVVAAMRRYGHVAATAVNVAAACKEITPWSAIIMAKPDPTMMLYLQALGLQPPHLLQPGSRRTVIDFLLTDDIVPLTEGTLIDPAAPYAPLLSLIEAARSVDMPFGICATRPLPWDILQHAMGCACWETATNKPAVWDGVAQDLPY